jgi:hypothetical protein
LSSVPCGTDLGTEAAAFNLLNELVRGHF